MYMEEMYHVYFNFKQDARLQGRSPGFRGGGVVTGKGQDRGKTRKKQDREKTETS